MKRLLIITLMTCLMLPATSWSRRSLETNYKHILKEWTRDDEAYNWDGLEARLVWHATYLSDAFRDAKVRRYAELYQLGQDEVERLRAQEKAEDAKYDSFFVSIYAGSRVHTDIGKDRSLWKLVLETSEGEVVEPQIWEEVPKNQVTRTLFPYIDRWARLFEVKFPKKITTGTERAQLKMVGVPADSTLAWDLRRLRG